MKSGKALSGVATGTIKEDNGGPFYGVQKSYFPLYDEEVVPFGYLLPDSTEDLDVRNIWCLALGKQYKRMDTFLVLVRKQEVGKGIQRFNRIGLGKIKYEEAKFFDDAGEETVELV